MNKSRTVLSKKKVLYVISNVNKALEFEWIAAQLKDKIDLEFILLNPGASNLEDFLIRFSIKVKTITYHGKMDVPKALLILIRYIKYSKPDIVHTHLIDANIVGLLAAKICKVKTRIHTRHHSTFHHDYYKKGIIYDKASNYLSTKIISISDIVSEVLIKKENVSPKKIVKISHGLDFDSFLKGGGRDQIISKYNLQNFFPVIGVISRFIEWKGIEYTIQAFKVLLKKYPNAKLILANANGSYEYKINSELECLPESSYRKIIFEEQISDLYEVFDIFVHVPTDRYAEAFGQVYIESLCKRIPSIFTISGVANEFIIDGKNALTVDYKNSFEIYDAIIQYLENGIDTEKIKEFGFISASKYDFKLKTVRLLELYNGS